MRLLQLQDGELNLTTFFGDDIPPYAILSHTWGTDEEEVTINDLMDRTGKNKAGYDKIHFCGKQAANDGLRYFWVDTCCIDKSSSQELSEAINSMYKWYRRARKCYVHLSDVSLGGSIGSDASSQQTWKPAFQSSRWFTRGWTLQELLAPTSVEFFSVEGNLLGDRDTLVPDIAAITGISVKALQGSPLADFSVEERLSWAGGRKTKREEDRAYSLLGIFDIHMPLIYGEGQEKAVRRLQKEIKESSTDLSSPPSRSAVNGGQSREETFGKIRRWLSAPDPSLNYKKALKQRQVSTGIWFLESEQYAKWRTDPSIVWLYGIPGCGKTVLSSIVIQHVLQECGEDSGEVLTYFYFDFNDMQKQDVERMVRSLIYQLLQQCVKIPGDLDTLFSSCKNGQQEPSLDALLNVMRQMTKDFPQVFIVLDALDECAYRTELMSILETMTGWQLPNLHLLVTSRRERDIENSLESFVTQENTICLQSEVVDRDIQKYVRQRLSDDKNLNKWHKDPTIRQEIEEAIMEGAHGMY